MAKILVIDDEPGMRQVITKILGPQGHSLSMAEDASQGLEVCKREKPDLALVDIRLTGMEGPEILAALKKIQPSLPVVMLTGFADTDTAAALVKQGASDYISKPFKVEELIRLVRKTLSLKDEMQQQVVQETPPPTQPAQEHTAASPSLQQSPPQPHPEPETEQPQHVAAMPRPVIRKTAPRMKAKKSFLSVKAIGIAVGVIAITAGGYFGVKLMKSGAPPDAEFSIAYTNPAALCWDGKFLWVSDWFTEAVYRHTPDATFSLTTSYKLPGMQIIGLAFDGSSIWSCSTFAGKIYKHNADPQLSIAAEFKSPGPSPSGLYFDGTYMWSLDFQQSKIYKHKIDGSLTVVETYDSPAAHPRGMFEYKNSFFLADSDNNRIVKVNPENFSVLGIYTLPVYEKGDKHLTSLAWDGKSIWTCADGVPKVFRHGMKSLKPAKF